MWNKLKGLFRRTPAEPPKETAAPVYKWYDVGPENPFGIRILDVRPLTQYVVATTTDKSLADKYGQLRHSDGREAIGAQIPESTWLEVDLRFPHNGASLEGIAFKAASMDEKWDIYIYDNCFLFTRSWSGKLVYRARARIEPAALVITAIECERVEAALAPAHVFFLLGTHAMRRILPHQLPAEAANEAPQTLATLSFSLFGNRAYYATFEDITRLPLQPPSAESK